MKQALTFDDHDPLTWGDLGDALYWTPGRREEALPAYQKAVSLAQAKLELNPRDATAAGYLAEYNAMLNKKELAMESAKRALSLANNDPDVLVPCCARAQSLWRDE